MSRKYFGLIATVALVLSGCSSTDNSVQPDDQDTAVEQSAADSTQEDEASEEDAGPAIPELLDTTHRRALAAEDLHDSVADGRLNVDGYGLHLELPDSFTRDTEAQPARIVTWSSADKQQSVVLSVAGTAGVVPDGPGYLEYLQKSALAAGYDIQYVGDVDFGEASVKEFHLSGAGRLLDLFAFEYSGISYELTLRATDQANLDNLHNFALATVISKETVPEKTSGDKGTADAKTNGDSANN